VDRRRCTLLSSGCTLSRGLPRLTSGASRVSSISRCLGCGPPAPHRLEKPLPNLRRAKSDTHCRLLGTAHRFHLRRDSLCSSGTRSRERSSRITSPSQPDRTLPASRKGDEGHDQSACRRLSPALGRSSRGLALRDHRLGSRSNLTHLFALSPPTVASAIDSVSFRLGHAVHESVLSNEPALMITMRRTDNCFPTPSTTSTRAS
jgi:hypothetical protein